METFIFEERHYQANNSQSKAAAFSVGNGYYGVRGFHEESQAALNQLGGIYQAGLFGQGVHETYDGSLNTELLNTANVFRIKILADGEVVELNDGQYSDFYQRLDLAKGLYQRGYQFNLSNGKTLQVSFERLAHLDAIHLLGHQIQLRASADMEIELTTMLAGDVTNLNLESTEPLPIQPGRKHLTLISSAENFLQLAGDYQQLELAYKVKEDLQGADFTKEATLDNQGLTPSNHYRFSLAAKQTVSLERIISSSHNLDNPNYLTELDQTLATFADYASLAASQAAAWQRIWETCDIKIQGDPQMQMGLRYNLFHLYSSAPRHTNKLSIGARGLTGEMYEGCIFWDLEIFKLPFFMFQFPEIAKNLLHFRYETLQAAKAHAKANWFDGAFFPWQVSSQGVEQTPKNVGAFYAIHIVADIAYAINKYMALTNDQVALKEFLGELLIETSRFWVSRVSTSKEHGYEILAVRGPNEYDVVVNNNCYTNTMAAQNLQITVSLLNQMAQTDRESYQELVAKTQLSVNELAKFSEIGANIWIPKDADSHLYLEDDRYLHRRKVPMSLLKPTAKRVIDSTLPYEALPLYQITKQADVVQLQNLLPEDYSYQEKYANFQFYLERTAHDSSLSICGYGLMAARLGLDDLSQELFKKAVFFDMEDRLLNTISGLHFANFGGVWQIATLGYFGIEVTAHALSFKPHLPNYLDGISTKISYLGNQLEISLTKQELTITVLKWTQDCLVEVNNHLITLTENSSINETIIVGGDHS